METVFFLESIFKFENEENEKNEETNHIILFNSTAFFENPSLNYYEFFTDQIIQNREIGIDFLSGFVKFENDRLVNANNTYIAKHFLSQNNAIRRFVMRNIVDVGEENTSSEEVFSYHVNVGHGNCSFIIRDKTIIAIDCSNFDYLKKKNYQNNIDKCINHITNKFGLKTFHIDYFILTHPHFDHYSGIDQLIAKRYIDTNTRFYLNIYYSTPSPILNKTLQNIYHCGCSIVEPISINSNNIIDIIYPDRRLVKTSATLHNSCNPIIDSNPNNSSIVARILGKNRSFTFTGDIETNAWDRVGGCVPNLKNTDYFAISHHGSINGHIRNQCPNNHRINQVSDCLQKKVMSVIMGRKGAYNGVPSPKVLVDFPNVVFSEHDKSGVSADYLEIEWANGSTKWF